MTHEHLQYGGGKMLIREPERLERIACECHGAIRSSLQALHGQR
jgi:hypothetical protein